MSAGISEARVSIDGDGALGVSGKRTVVPRQAGQRGHTGLVTGRPLLRLVWSAPGQSIESEGGSPAAGRGSTAVRPVAAPGPAGLRLTRRGRVVLAAVLFLAVIAMVAVVRTGTASGSQASGRDTPASSPYSGMTQVVVRPGQTLWSVAAAAEPLANTWTVMQEIVTVNALSGTRIQAGQVLWVPRCASCAAG
jgi:nucleoid-associated protein YgaU